MPRILVADDNANIQKMVVLAFQERGIDVTTVGNGEAAVRRLPDLNPDLVLADVFMPVRNGYEVCEFVKKDPRFAHIPVILLVGAFDPLDEKEARRVGADGVLKKPFVPPDPLIAMVMSALEKNPKLVAEVANAKKAATVPVSAMPLEGHSSTKLKAVPDFPEASAEDKRPSYGFEKNARALDDTDLDRGSTKPTAPAAETDDEVSGETAHKEWRRSAMDFEIPVEDASRPALSPDEHLDSAMFPSERDVPPRHIRMRDVESETENDARTTVWHSAETTSMADAPPVVEAPLPGHDAGEVARLPILAVVSTDPPRSEPPMQIPVPEAHAEATAEESKLVVHWMDMMAPLPSAPLSSDWMSALKASAVPEKHPLSPAIPAATIPAVVEPAVSNIESSSEVVASPSLPTDQVAAPSEAQSEVEEPFFADDLVAAQAPGFDDNLMVTAPDPAVPANLKDPYLVGPVSVHVTPEPLLVNDDAGVSAEYDSHAEETAPMHSLDYQVAATSAQVNSEDEENVEEKPATSESILEEASARAESIAPPVEPESEHTGAPSVFAESNPVHWAERVPTVPPPNREALADIPFLTPPAAFQSQHSENGIDSATVDAVVRKVMERLESQLHDILSQSALKPLVENLLEDEMAKKSR